MRLIIATILCIAVTLIVFSSESFSRAYNHDQVSSEFFSAQEIVPNYLLTNSLRLEILVGSVGSNKTITIGGNSLRPIASIAKLLAVLGVLAIKPLPPGQSGPVINISSEDSIMYQQDLLSNQSTSFAVPGESISEYQALQAILMPSSNNMAVTTVDWAFGSPTNYTSFINSYLKKLGLRETKVSDISGLSPDTTSTPTDLFVLAKKVLRSRVLDSVISQQVTILPPGVLIVNTNTDLGQEGIFGIKTGNTSAAGGCFIFAANKDGQTVIGVILGEPNLRLALKLAPKLVIRYLVDVYGYKN